MKARYRVLLVVVPLLLAGFHARRAGAPAFATGAPGEPTCAACHTGNPVNDASGSMTIVAPSTYVPGETVELLVRAQRSGAVLFGFEITAFDDAGQPAGTFDVSGPGIQLAVGSSHHVTHDPAVESVDSFEWTVPWEAPVAGSGNVTFYAATNAANGDFSTSGDFIFAAEQASMEAGGTSVDGGNGGALPGATWTLQSVWPNPVRDMDVSLRLEGEPGARFSIAVHDVQGRVVWSHAAYSAVGSGERVLAGTSSLAPGVYVLRVSGAGMGLGSDGTSDTQTRLFTKLR